MPIPAYVADAIEVWESLRPPNQEAREDRKTRKPTHYLFQYRNEVLGQHFLNKHAIPLLCTLAGVSQTDVVGRITSHRARATTATWMRKMGMAAADIGKLLGHTNPVRSLPWYLREDKYHLGRSYRKANPMERYVAAILDTETSPVRELVRFARRLRAEWPHVVAGLTHPESLGQTEGCINRLKTIKRQMYGRARFPLLRQRVLHAA